jgi:hypothetical protein
MDVIILSKTHMNHGKCCVGGLADNGEYVRLLTNIGENQPENTPFKIRQIWSIEYEYRHNNIHPHIEDVLIQSKSFIGDLKPNFKVIDIIKERKSKIWYGSPNNLFDELIKWTSGGSGYINKDSVPDHSVGFWISNKDLIRRDYNGVRYSYPSENSWRSLKFVGLEDPISNIPAGTLIRVSLARWWKQDANTEDRCFLQLSGWYDI